MNEPLTSLRSIDTKYLGAFAILLAAVTFVYWPGLVGPFLFDDFGSISELGALGGVSDWQTFKAFIFGGFTGPTGRPVALLSFLIDGNNWPTEPLPFKRTNLVIHLLNGVLLGILTLQILKLTDVQSQHAKWLALLSAGCWLLHPFLVSTTLYVVQRMAQLATTFVFLGLITYLHGRGKLTANRVSAYVIMSLGLGVFTTLAVLSKENGALLPLLAGVLEITVLARAGTVSLNRYWAAIFIVVPTLFIAAYLGSRVFRDDFFELVAPRDYSIYERLLTQSRVLVDYLHHWFMPKLYTTGLFQDHFGKSSGILAPVTTLVSIIFNCLLITLAVVKRKAWPLFAMAILFSTRAICLNRLC